jgi:DNA polymerase-3 subunit gamma/tau
MSYQVLARKWRPRTFADMVGQEHVLKALVNALDNNRLHHAYLFTGTRGVGKTTIARILAKCINCEAGVSSQPCGECSSCKEIDEGRFIDLIEVDAASRTKVEDTRELLENVQYAPTRGRYKVYLIDEVHMLSTHSFNALLKTLEEPPPHVKFLLATTDPQKLPITILSRCLQFSLKNMLPERIVNHLKFVLGEEKIPFEEPALWQLGRAADGSMRDALSLTDQAISFGNGKVLETDVRSMLGTIDRSHVYQLLNALVNNDATQLLKIVADLSEYAPDFAGVLADMLSILHRVSVEQQVPGAVDNSEGDQEHIQILARDIEREDVQLFYQIALMGRRDLAYSPDPRMGFEMTLLRMLAFKPTDPDNSGARNQSAADHATTQKKNPDRVTTVTRSSVTTNHHTQSNVVAISQTSALQNPVAEPLATVAEKSANVVQLSVVPSHRPLKPSDNLPALKDVTCDDWLAIYQQLPVDALARNIAAQCILRSCKHNRITLHLKKEYAGVLNDAHHARLAEAFTQLFGQTIELTIEPTEVNEETPAAYKIRMDAQRQAQAVKDIEHDRHVQALIRDFKAEIQTDSIVPVDLPKEK